MPRGNQISYASHFQVTVEILDDNQWEPTEEFFLKLTIEDNGNSNVELGKISIMEVTILDDDGKGYMVKFSAT